MFQMFKLSISVATGYYDIKGYKDRPSVSPQDNRDPERNIYWQWQLLFDHP